MANINKSDCIIIIIAQKLKHEPIIKVDDLKHE